MNRRDIRGQVDPKSAEILLAIQNLGEATTNEIRQRTGLTASETQYRRNKLANMELIDLVTVDTHLRSQYEWSLTGLARRELARGLGATANLIIYEEPDSHEVGAQEFREMQEELRRLREAQKASAYDSYNKEVVQRDEFDELAEYVYLWTETAEQYLLALRSVVERYVPGVNDLTDHFDGNPENNESANNPY